MLLQHGFGLSSEAWVLQQREHALAYQLADAGYDVWLGNQRGNEYAQQHTSLDQGDVQFWNFSFHEMGYYDLAGIIDYMLAKTNNTALHYVGYSQGTMVLMVLLSTRSEYQSKIHSTHLLAPVAYMNNMKPSFMVFTGALTTLGKWFLNWFGHKKILHYNHFALYQGFCNLLCGQGAALNPICRFIYNFVGGPGMQGINEATLFDVCLSQPVGVSMKQFLHLTQIHATGQFQLYDYGAGLNELHYKQDTAPMYNLSSIENCFHLYYGVTDYLADVVDVKRLAQQLPCAILQPISAHDNYWNHYDFLWSDYAKDLLNGHILRVLNEKENWL